jgi:hypothetical protein
MFLSQVFKLIRIYFVNKLNSMIKMNRFTKLITTKSYLILYQDHEGHKDAAETLASCFFLFFRFLRAIGCGRSLRSSSLFTTKSRLFQSN